MLVMGYLGAVVGAGFASGQEIVQFFVNYGNSGIKGAFLTAGLFAACGGMLLYMAHSHQVSNYQDILRFILGQKTGKVVDIGLAVFLFLGISTMLSASGAIFYEHFYLPKGLGVFVTYLIIVILLATGKKGLIMSYNLLVPVKLMLLIAITGYAAFFFEARLPETYVAFLDPYRSNNWLLASLLYVAYNFSLAMVVLTEYQSVTTQKGSISGAIWGGLVLGLLVITYYLALNRFMPMITHYEVPMLFIAGNISLPAKWIYTGVLWVGILTTALANAYGFSQRISSLSGLNYGFCLIMCMTLALPLSMQSFSVLVNRVYPVFGALGLVILGSLVYKAVIQLGQELYYNIIQILKKTKEV
ncbi:MAG: hypothetical protein ACOX6I_01225 [Syntrophomonadaceae bacterium]|jgi:uncharacterized membrane protein YkvI